MCNDILIKGCVIEVNDDAVALKGGKGPWADSLPENGINERIIIDDGYNLLCQKKLGLSVRSTKEYVNADAFTDISIT